MYANSKGCKKWIHLKPRSNEISENSWHRLSGNPRSMGAHTRFTIDQYGNPGLYLWAFLVIPFNTPRSTSYIFAFHRLNLDSLEQSGGAHTIASLVMPLKPTLENFYTGQRRKFKPHFGRIKYANFLPLTFLPFLFIIRYYLL